MIPETCVLPGVSPEANVESTHMNTKTCVFQEVSPETAQNASHPKSEEENGELSENKLRSSQFTI